MTMRAPEWLHDAQRALYLQSPAGVQDSPVAQQDDRGHAGPGLCRPGRARSLRAGVRQRLLPAPGPGALRAHAGDRKSTRLNSSHLVISYAVFCLKKKKIEYLLSPKLDGVMCGSGMVHAYRLHLLWSRVPASDCNHICI